MCKEIKSGPIGKTLWELHVKCSEFLGERSQHKCNTCDWNGIWIYVLIQYCISYKYLGGGEGICKYWVK